MGTRRAHRDTGRAGVSRGDLAPPPRHGARWCPVGSRHLARLCHSSERSCLSRGKELTRPGRGSLRSPASQPFTGEESRERALQALLAGAVENSQDEGPGMGAGGGPLPVSSTHHEAPCFASENPSTSGQHGTSASLSEKRSLLSGAQWIQRH